MCQKMWLKMPKKNYFNPFFWHFQKLETGSESMASSFQKWSQKCSSLTNNWVIDVWTKKKHDEGKGRRRGTSSGLGFWLYDTSQSVQWFGLYSSLKWMWKSWCSRNSSSSSSSSRNPFIYVRNFLVWDFSFRHIKIVSDCSTMLHRQKLEYTSPGQKSSI